MPMRRLQVAQLVVQTARRAAAGAGVIVLDKGLGNAELGKPPLMVGLEKKAARITKNLQLDDDDVGNRGIEALKHCVLLECRRGARVRQKTFS